MIKNDMDLNKVLFRPVRETLDESMREVVAFDDMHQLIDYILFTLNIVPHLSYYCYDYRINWNVYVVLNNSNGIPIGWVHIPNAYL